VLRAPKIALVVVVSPQQKGFTLLELSIVLMIIGLIVGGIMGGKYLIRAGQLRDVVSEYGQYVKAIKEFQDKYQALPGDMANATTFWGAETSCPNPTYNATPHTATCNGDGNGMIYNRTTTAWDGTTAYEMFRAWQQLANAGFIRGGYSGMAGQGGVEYALPGVNVPASQLSGAGWTLFWLGSLAPSCCTWYYTGNNYGHILAFGAVNAAVYKGTTETAVITPSEALDIDSKIDDGMPGTGKVAASANIGGGLPNCVSGTGVSTDTYNVSYTSIACDLFFTTGM